VSDRQAIVKMQCAGLHHDFERGAIVGEGGTRTGPEFRGRLQREGPRGLDGAGSDVRNGAGDATNN